MGMKNGVRLDYKQEIPDETMKRAKAECEFSDRLYEILLAYQNGLPLPGRPPNVPPGNVGELNHQMSRLYNLIWASMIGLNDKARSKKKNKQQMEIITQ